MDETDKPDGRLALSRDKVRDIPPPNRPAAPTPLYQRSMFSLERFDASDDSRAGPPDGVVAHFYRHRSHCRGGSRLHEIGVGSTDFHVPVTPGVFSPVGAPQLPPINPLPERAVEITEVFRSVYPEGEPGHGFPVNGELAQCRPVFLIHPG